MSEKMAAVKNEFVMNSLVTRPHNAPDLKRWR